MTRQTRFAAEVFGPWAKGQSTAATIDIGTWLVVTLDGGRRLELPLASLKISRGGFDLLSVVLAGTATNGEALHVIVHDVTVLAALDQHGAHAMRAQAATVARSHSRGRVWRWVAAPGAVLLFVALLAGAWLGLPLLVDVAVDRIPVSLEEELGAASVESIVAGQPVLEDGPVHAAVKTVFDRVVLGVGATPYTFHLTVVDTPTVNALAAPGGQVVVFTGLVFEVESAEELAGVLAHELRHVTARHGLRQLIRSGGVVLAIALCFGDVSGLAVLVKTLGDMSYSRDAEREADTGAVAILRRARVDPTRFREFFARMAKHGSSLPAILSTHPQGDERDASLRALTAGATSSDWDPITVDWAAVRALKAPR